MTKSRLFIAIFAIYLAVGCNSSTTKPSTGISSSYTLASLTPDIGTVNKGSSLLVAGTFTVTGAAPNTMMYIETCFGTTTCSKIGVLADYAGSLTYPSNAPVSSVAFPVGNIAGTYDLTVDVSTTMDHAVKAWSQKLRTITVK